MRSVYQSEPQETVLFHGPNRIGLGHLNRLSAIALALKKKSPHVRPLFAVEGGAHVAHDFHAAGLVDRYVVYLAPAFLGGDDGRPVFAGPGAPSIDDVWRGTLISVERLGDDVRVEVAA